VNRSIGVDQDTLGSKALRTVAGDRVAMIEMTVLSRIEFDLAVVIQAGSNATFRSD
jgi:hypothetical protein